MALTVGTNSYVSSSDADAYFQDRLYADDWTGTTSGDREKALMMARRAIDRQSFAGEFADEDQLLAWPRKNINGVDGATVPQDVKDAQCELALAFLREDLTADDGARGVKRLQAGSVAVEYDGRAPEKRLPEAALVLLQPFMLPSDDNTLEMVF